MTKTMREERKERFSLMLDEKTDKCFILVDKGIITESIFKKDGEWVGGLQLVLEPVNWIFISEFKEWSKGKSFVIKGNNKEFFFSEKDVSNMKKAVMERDKRLKIK